MRCKNEEIVELEKKNRILDNAYKVLANQLQTSKDNVLVLQQKFAEMNTFYSNQYNNMNQVLHQNQSNQNYGQVDERV